MWNEWAGFPDLCGGAAGPSRSLRGDCQVAHITPTSSILRLHDVNTSSPTPILGRNKLNNNHHGVHGGDMGPSGPASPPCCRREDHKRGSHQDRQCGEALTRPSSVYSHQERLGRPTPNSSGCSVEAAEAMVLPCRRKKH